MHINGLDEIDDQIVALLVENARFTYSEIGERVGLSRVAVKNRVSAWTIAHQAFLSITNSQSLLKLIYIELVMPSNHLILCHPLLIRTRCPDTSPNSSL